MTHDDTNTSSLTLEALLAAHAARTPAEKERDLAYAVAADLGLHAQQLADHHLARGDLTNARRWYQVAAHYDIPGAADALNDVETLIEVAATVEAATHDYDRHDTFATGATGDAGTADRDVTQITVLDDLAAAAALVRRAQEHAAQTENRARAILDEAREEANRIVASARHEADRDTEQVDTVDFNALWRVHLLTAMDPPHDPTARVSGGSVDSIRQLRRLQQVQHLRHLCGEVTRPFQHLVGQPGEAVELYHRHREDEPHDNLPLAMSNLSNRPATFLYPYFRTVHIDLLTKMAERLPSADQDDDAVPGSIAHTGFLFACSLLSGSQDLDAAVAAATRWVKKGLTIRSVSVAWREAVERLRLPDFHGSMLWTPASAATHPPDEDWAPSPRETIRVGGITGAALRDLGTTAHPSSERDTPPSA